jgi:hypothetical protein
MQFLVIWTLILSVVIAISVLYKNDRIPMF